MRAAKAKTGDMAASSGLEELRTLYAARNALSEDTGPRWVDRVSELLHELSPTHAELFDDHAQYLFAGLSGYSVEPIWSQIGSLLRAAIAEIRRREASMTASPAPDLSDPRVVFVVHGRHKALRTDLFAFLRALNLTPLEWSQAVSSTGKAAPYIGEVLEAAFRRAQAVVVLLTPDDEVRLSEALWAEDEEDAERAFQMQARPNVLFEAGMAFGTHFDRTLLVQVGRVKKFSDIAGRHVLRLDNSAERRQAIAERLRVAGCPVDTSGSEWLRAGDFDVKVPVPSVSPVKHAPRRRADQQDLDVRMGRLGSWRDPQILVRNLGSETAHGIRILADGQPIEKHSVYLSGQNLPTSLRSGEELGVKIAVGIRSPERAEIQIAWSDDSGQEHTVERAVQLI